MNVWTSRAAMIRSTETVESRDFINDARVRGSAKKYEAVCTVVVRGEIHRTGQEPEPTQVVERYNSIYAAMGRVVDLGRSGLTDIDLIHGSRLVAFWNAWNGWLTASQQAGDGFKRDVLSWGGGPVVAERKTPNRAA